MSTQPADNLPATEPPLTDTPPPPAGPSLGALVEALVFVCRFFGSPVQQEVLLASATALGEQVAAQLRASGAG